MIEDLNKLAREIIQSNQYMSIATVDKNNNPWISPVAYAYDQQWNLYFVSIPSSKHGSNFEINPNVALAIFDSRQLIAEGVGLQMEGVVEEIEIKKTPEALAIIYNRRYPFGSLPSAFAIGLKKLLQQKLYRCYRIVPKTVWMNNPNVNTDERIKVNLNLD